MHICKTATEAALVGRGRIITYYEHQKIILFLQIHRKSNLWEKAERLGLLIPAESLRDNLTAVHSYARSLYKDDRAQLSSTAADKEEQPQTVACIQIRKFKSGITNSFFPLKAVQHRNRWPSGTAEWTRQSYNWPDWVLVTVPIQTENWSEWLPEVPSNKHLCDLRSKVIFIHDASRIISINSVGFSSTRNLTTTNFLLSTERGLALI